MPTRLPRAGTRRSSAPGIGPTCAISVPAEWSTPWLLPALSGWDSSRRSSSWTSTSGSIAERPRCRRRRCGRWSSQAGGGGSILCSGRTAGSPSAAYGHSRAECARGDDSSGWRRMSLEENGCAGLRLLASRDPNDHPGELLVGGIDGDVVELEKDERRSQRGPLIAIDERVVLRQVEEVRGGHLEQRPMEQLASERGLRRRNAREEQPSIAHPERAAVRLDLVSVDAEHLLEQEEARLLHSASFLKTAPWRRSSLRRIASTFAERFLSAGGEMMMTRPSVETST